MSNQQYDFSGEEFNVFEEQKMWWNEDAFTIKQRLEDLEDRIFKKEMTANQNDLNYLYKLAFLNYRARSMKITMTKNILSRLKEKGIKDGLKKYIPTEKYIIDTKKFKDFILNKKDEKGKKDPFEQTMFDPNNKNSINNFKGVNSEGLIHNIAKLLWYALVTLSKGSAFDIFKTFVDQSPYDETCYIKYNFTKDAIENVFLGNENFKQYRYNEYEGYIRLVGEDEEEFVYKKSETEFVLKPVPEETELMLTQKTSDLVVTMLECLAKSSENISYTLTPLKKMAQYGFASQVSQQLENKKGTRKILFDLTSKQMYIGLDSEKYIKDIQNTGLVETKYYLVGSKTDLNIKNDVERIYTVEESLDGKSYTLNAPVRDHLDKYFQKFPLYTEGGWQPFKKKFLYYADELHLSEQTENWSHIGRINLKKYIQRWLYVQDSFKIIFEENGWETIRDKRAAYLIDKGLFHNMDDEKNETYNFGRVVLQNDEGDKKGDVYEPNFLKLFWQANKPPEVVATNDKINELGKTIPSYWVYFRDSLGKNESIMLDQIKDHVTELHDSMEPALQELSTFLMGEVVEPAEAVLERYLMSEKKIIYNRDVSFIDIDKNFHLVDFVKKLEKKNKKALLVFLLGYYTLRKDVDKDNDFHEENGYLADRIKKGENGVFHFMLYESFLNNVFEQKTIACDAFVNFLHTDAEKNSDLAKNNIATEYPCYLKTFGFANDIMKCVTAIHDGESFKLYSSDANMPPRSVSKFSVNLHGVPWSANYADVADKDYWLAFENYRTIFFYWNTLYYVLKKLTEQLADELDLKNVYQTYLRMYTEDRIAEQLVSDLEYLSVRKNIEKFSERERLRIFQSKTKTQIAPLAKELDEENQKKIDELYTFAILESKKRINKERNQNMTDEDVNNILRKYITARTRRLVKPAYLLDRDV